MSAMWRNAKIDSVSKIPNDEDQSRSLTRVDSQVEYNNRFHIKQGDKYMYKIPAIRYIYSMKRKGICDSIRIPNRVK